jgi:protein SCO1/2
MAQLNAVLDALGEQAQPVRIVFISVDPHRDTPAALQAYVNAFSSQAIGLTGNASQIADLARRYRVAYQIDVPKPGAEPGTYDVTHSRGIYIFDRHGKARLLAANTDSTQDIIHDLRQLMQTTR